MSDSKNMGSGASTSDVKPKKGKSSADAKTKTFVTTISVSVEGQTQAVPAARLAQGTDTQPHGPIPDHNMVSWSKPASEPINEGHDENADPSGRSDVNVTTNPPPKYPLHPIEHVPTCGNTDGNTNNTCTSSTREIRQSISEHSVIQNRQGTPDSQPVGNANITEDGTQGEHAKKPPDSTKNSQGAATEDTTNAARGDMRDAPAEKNGSNYSGTKSTEREKEPKVDYNNSDEALFDDSPPSGLENSGNSCYLNAAVQFLLAAKPFRDTFGHDHDGVEKRFRQKSLSKALSDLVPKMIYYNEKSVDARQFRKIAGSDHDIFTHHGQEDCLEYLLHILNKIEEDFPKEFSDVNPCNKLRIEFCEEIARSGEPTDYIYRKEIVLSCPLVYDETDGHQHNARYPERQQHNRGHNQHPWYSGQDRHYNQQQTTQYYYYEQPRCVRLVDCINKFMAKEQIMSRTDRQIHKMSRIAVFPSYLIVHLRKMKISKNGESIKLKVKTMAPDELNLTDWECEEGWLTNCKKNIKSTENQIKVYNLKAFVTHYGGTTYVGHYVCHVKYGSDWYMFNDSRRYKRSAYEIEKEKEDGLFYLYQQNNRTKEQIQKEQTQL